MPGFFKQHRYQVEWKSQDGTFRTAKTYLRRTAEKYAELLRSAHGFEVTIREL